MKKVTLIIFISLLSFPGWAQISSENGWKLSASDTIRILLVFAEINYDINPELDQYPSGTEDWQPGELPVYKDSIFEPFPTEQPKAMVTRYFNEMSLGNYTVLGDYVSNLVTINYSELNGKNLGSFKKKVVEALNLRDTVVTANALSAGEFDLWHDERMDGAKKQRRTGEFEGVDHVMLIVRNHPSLPRQNGQASGGSIGYLFGKPTNSHSLFNGAFGLPLMILKHEFSHLLVGGNNFHSGGGNRAGFSSYFIPLQDGWTLMGGSIQSLVTCSGWDRYWLGWKDPDRKFLIAATDEQGQDISGDLDASNAQDSGIYVLRDFVTTGDVLRIKLPFIPETQFQQWLWIENHTTTRLNNSPFDDFRYHYFDCMESALPGLYMQMQVDANRKQGNKLYSEVHADYLRPIVANGNYDPQLLSDSVNLGWCVGRVNDIPFIRMEAFENPLTGTHDLERTVMPLKQTQQSLSKDDMRNKTLQHTDTGYIKNLNLGRAVHAFRESGIYKISMGTNPTTASMLSYVNSRRPVKKENPQNNRTTFLNGISIEILETFEDGTVKVEVRFDNVRIDENRRWCSPHILLSDVPNASCDLDLFAELTLDQGQTAIRLSNPDTVNGKTYFTSPTFLEVDSNAVLRVNEGGILRLKSRSRILMNSTASLLLAEKAKIDVENNSILEFSEGSIFNAHPKARILIAKGGKVVCHTEEMQYHLKKICRPSSRVQYMQ